MVIPRCCRRVDSAGSGDIWTRTSDSIRRTSCGMVEPTCGEQAQDRTSAPCQIAYIPRSRDISANSIRGFISEMNHEHETLFGSKLKRRDPFAAAAMFSMGAKFDVKRADASDAKRAIVSEEAYRVDKRWQLCSLLEAREDFHLRTYSWQIEVAKSIWSREVK